MTDTSFIIQDRPEEKDYELKKRGGGGKETPNSPLLQ